MDGDVNINDEYEKLFGRAKSINLFDSDEEYENLRQYIINQPNFPTQGKCLPFNDIKLTPYDEYMWLQEIESATYRGKHVFFIKQNNPYCRAACYFDSNRGAIILLRYSYIVSSNSYGKNINLLTDRRKLLMYNSCQNSKGRYITENVECSSPLVAASYVLGRKAELSEWCDEKGKSIVTFY